MKRSLAAAWCLFLALVAACGPESSGNPGTLSPIPIPATPPTLAVDVGGGVRSFTELKDGDAVSLVHGSQGGSHIWTSVRVHDVTVTDVQINLSARFEDGSPAGPPSRVAVTLLTDGNARVTTGQRNFIADPGATSGRRVILRAEVLASDQRHGAAERVVTVDP